MLDENELEDGCSCVQDVIKSAGPNGILTKPPTLTILVPHVFCTIIQETHPTSSSCH